MKIDLIYCDSNLICSDIDVFTFLPLPGEKRAEEKVMVCYKEMVLQCLIFQRGKYKKQYKVQSVGDVKVLSFVDSTISSTSSIKSYYDSILIALNFLVQQVKIFSRSRDLLNTTVQYLDFTDSNKIEYGIIPDNTNFNLSNYLNYNENKLFQKKVASSFLVKKHYFQFSNKNSSYYFNGKSVFMLLMNNFLDLYVIR